MTRDTAKHGAWVRHRSGQVGQLIQGPNGWDVQHMTLQGLQVRQSVDLNDYELHDELPPPSGSKPPVRDVRSGDGFGGLGEKRK